MEWAVGDAEVPVFQTSRWLSELKSWEPSYSGGVISKPKFYRLSGRISVVLTAVSISCVFAFPTLLNAWTYTSPQVAVAVFGGSSTDTGISIGVDASGNVYTAGNFQSLADFDPGAGNFDMTSAGSRDVYITKIDASGVLVWAKQLGGISDDVVSGMSVDPSGNVYLAGNFQGTADFDPSASALNLTSAGGQDAYIAKLDSSGNLVWAKQLGGTLSDVARNVTVDGSGNVFVVGGFQGTADFDPSAGVASYTTAGSQDGYVWKLDASGNYVWAKYFGGSSIDHAVWIDLGSNGAIYVAGFFLGTADLDPGAGTANFTAAVQDAYVLKLDASGNYVWAKVFTGPSAKLANALALDSADNVYITGSFQGAVDFDPSASTVNVTAVGGQDGYIAKLDALGNYVWALSLGGSSSDAGYAVTTDSAGNVIVDGIFQGTVDFDPGAGTANATSAGAQDGYVWKLSGSGSYVWSRQIGGIGADYAQWVTTDVSNNVYLGGYFNDTVDFDPSAGVANLTTLGATDAFAWKLDALGFSSAPTSSTSTSTTSSTTSTTTTVAPTTTVAGSVFNASAGTTTTVAASSKVPSSEMPTTGASTMSFVLWSSLLLSAGALLQLRVRRLVG